MNLKQTFLVSVTAVWNVLLNGTLPCPYQKEEMKYNVLKIIIMCCTVDPECHL